MNYILFDGKERDGLLPFTYTRPIADIRIGILTIREKWEKMLGASTSTLTVEYLSEKFPMTNSDKNVFINASFLPNPDLITEISSLTDNQLIKKDEDVIAYSSNTSETDIDLSTFEAIEYKDDLIQVRNAWDIFDLNDKALRADFKLLTEGRKSAPIPDTVQCENREDIFLEEGVQINFAMLNASMGPIYFGKNSKILEGAMIHGPLSLGEGAMIKMGAKIYGATTIGPFCKVAGEVNNSVLFGYSSKGHEGYLGNSVLGEWCNLGADTNISNLKNNYAEIRLWSYETERFAKTGLRFCGLIMGDHSKCGINTMYNTGTVVGVSANIFGSGYPRNFIPSFSWGGASGFKTYNVNKVHEVAEIVMARRSMKYTAVDKAIIEHISSITEKYRQG